MKQENSTLFEHIKQTAGDLLAWNKELREKEYLLRQIAENSNAAYYLLDAEAKKVFYINHFYENLFGRTCKDFYKNPFDHFNSICHDDRKKIRSYWKKYKPTFCGEYQIILPNKQMRWISEQTFPIFTKAGKISLIVGVARDITQIKKTQTELLLKNMLLETLTETSPNGVLVTDNKQKIQYYNDRVVVMLRFPKNLLNNENQTERLQYFLPEIVNPKGFIERIQYINKHNTEQSKDTIAFKDGRMIYRYSIPICSPYDQTTWRIWHFIDVSSLVKAKTKIEEQLENLKGLDKTKTDFMNTFSHELKTPITAMLLHLQILQEQKENLNEQQQKSLHAIQRNTKQLQLLIDNILEISRIESETFKLNLEKEHDIGDCINKAIEDLHIFSDKKGIKLIIHMQSLPRVTVDCTRIKEIINNLVGNAIKFTNNGSVSVSAKKQGDNILISVCDTGIGIAKEHLPLLTQKFYQVIHGLGKKNGGTGLGLAIAKQLIELHHGKLMIESTAGKGSTFSFTIPIKQK